jgi:prepilin peptidase CpaA
MSEISDFAPNSAALCLAITLLIATATDVASHRIPNALLAPALAVALLLGTMAAGITGLVAVVAGLCVGLLMLLPLYIAGGTSAGDVKLLGVAGAYLGPSGALFAGLFTFIAGAVLGVLWIVVGRHVVPAIQQFLAQADLPLSTSGIQEDTRQEASPNSFAYAPAILAGAATAAWYQGGSFFGS